MATYALGSNGNYQLGLGHDDDVWKPTQCLKGMSLLQIASGGNHTLAITTEGKLYGAGLTTNGQLSGEEQHVIDWDPIYTGFKVGKAACGWEFSVIVNETLDKVFSCGAGPKGELGLNRDSSAEFVQINDFPPSGHKITDIKAGMSHVVALLDNGSVYGWGAGRKGQLGPAAAKTVPTPVKFDDNITHIACGRDFTVLGNHNNGSVKVLGREMNDLPPSLPFKDLQSGWSTIHALLKSGRVESFGNNSHKQHAPPQIEQIEEISAGTEHVLAKTSTGKCLAWGWSEHGNCGNNGIELALDVDKIWAGYATSFFTKS